MSCLNGLQSQILTFVSTPHEILTLQHKVFREYAKVAVGPDFVHTLPSLLIVTTMALVLWKNPPTWQRLHDFVGVPWIYRSFQVTTSWITINAILWFWLIFQRILYCAVWTQWSHESEYRDSTQPWWQRVWSLYYPPPLQPPLLSCSFISWIISMSVATVALGCAIVTNRTRFFLEDSLIALQYGLSLLKCYTKWFLVRLRDLLIGSESMAKMIDECEDSYRCDECESSIVSIDSEETTRHEIHPISYGTNWTPKPIFANYNKDTSQRKVSVKSLHSTIATNDARKTEKNSNLMQRRGCHAVIPNNSSDRSSEC